MLCIVFGCSVLLFSTPLWPLPFQILCPLNWFDSWLLGGSWSARRRSWGNQGTEHDVGSKGMKVPPRGYYPSCCGILGQGHWAGFWGEQVVPGWPGSSNICACVSSCKQAAYRGHSAANCPLPLTMGIRCSTVSLLRAGVFKREPLQSGLGEAQGSRSPAFPFAVFMKMCQIEISSLGLRFAGFETGMVNIQKCASHVKVRSLTFSPHSTTMSGFLILP